MTIFRCISLLAGFVFVALPSLAQDTAPPPAQGPSNTASDHDNPVIAMAQQSALLAGAARYCQLDEDMVDEFISIAEARIAMLAKDDYEKILGKLEFKNFLATASTRAPAQGCTQLENTFPVILRDMQ